ncbi:hypothetical protein BC332_19796 [Capsicum chinense]|nr:hypothetical protein BC332_19796 [Capsicum chinense]
MVDCQDSRVGMETGTGSLWISEDDKFEDHEYGVKDDEVEIPKNKNDDDDDNKRRICHVCSKGFGSGKALGGHMRIHVQASKKLLLSCRKGKKSKTVLQTDEEEDDQLLPTCSICGKNFPSMKSLFGHMRCHPERAWRGIQPPEDIDRKTAAASTVTVPVWSVTAKRGRKANAEDATYSGSKDEEQLHDAVHHLMLLANGDSIESGLTGGGIPEKTNSNSLTSNKKKTKLRHLDENYKCNTCGKTFATHQALGGHNKFRIVIQNSDVTNIGANSQDAAAVSQRILDFDLNELPPDHEDEQLSRNHDYYFPFFPM